MEGLYVAMHGSLQVLSPAVCTVFSKIAVHTDLKADLHLPGTTQDLQTPRISFIRSTCMPCKHDDDHD